VELLLRLSRRIDRLNDAVGSGVSWLALVMVLLGAFNAVARYLGRFVGTDLSSNAYLEGQWYLFSLLFLLGAAWTLRQDRHVRVDVLYGRLSPRARTWIDLVGSLLFLLPFCAFALWVSWPSVRNSIATWEVSPDPGGLPRWPLKAVVLVAFGLLALQGVSEAIKRLAVLRGRVPPDDSGRPAVHESGGHEGWAEGAS
jgi:TRAP-type mannitol/chloroaromatic compound transport system permease small subunit